VLVCKEERVKGEILCDSFSKIEHAVSYFSIFARQKINLFIIA